MVAKQQIYVRSNDDQHIAPHIPRMATAEPTRGACFSRLLTREMRASSCRSSAGARLQAPGYRESILSAFSCNAPTTTHRHNLSVEEMLSCSNPNAALYTNVLS